MAELVIIYDSAVGSFLSKQIGSTHLLDAAVTSGKLAAGSVISGAIASGAIGTPHIAQQAITSALVAANILATPHIANQGILSASIGAAIVGGAHLNASDVWPARTFSGGLTVGLGAGARTAYQARGGPFEGWLGHYTTMEATGPQGWLFGSRDSYEFWLEPSSVSGSAKIVFTPYSDLALARSLGIGVAQPSVSGRIAVGEFVDGVDISAHTHTGGAGDAGLILSASIGANILATPHIQNQGILSASLGPGAVGTPHLAPSLKVSGGFDIRMLSGSRVYLDDSNANTNLWLQSPDGSVLLGIEATWTGATVITQRLSGQSIAFRLNSGLVYQALTLDPPGDLNPSRYVDGIDLSAHTHTGGAGDAGVLTSAGVASGVLGGAHFRNQSILSASIGANVLATPHIWNQGILSASIGANVLATPHIQNQGILSASLGPGAVGTPHLAPSLLLSGGITIRALSGSSVVVDDTNTNANLWLRRPDGSDLLGIEAAWSGATLITQRLSGQSIAFRLNSGLIYQALTLDPPGDLSPSRYVDGIDLSAHTHTGGAGDAGVLTSAGVASGVLGGAHFRNQSILSASIGANVLATPHFANQGILSASIGANILATPHIQAGGILSASIGANVLATPHIANQGVLSASLAPGAVGTPHLAPSLKMSGGLDIRMLSGSLVYLDDSNFNTNFWLQNPDGSVLLGIEATWTGATVITQRLSGQSLLVRLASGAANVYTALSIDPPGDINPSRYVDGIDASAHTHTGGTGDAGVVLSAGIGLGALATPHIANQGILSASIGANILATPHIANQGILSSAIGLNILATPHILAGGILSASIASGLVLPMHFEFCTSSHIVSNENDITHTLFFPSPFLSNNYGAIVGVGAVISGLLDLFAEQSRSISSITTAKITAYYAISGRELQYSALAFRKE